MTIEIIADLFRNVAFIALYIFTGLGPGFVFGILLANRIWGRGNPTFKQIHEESIEKGLEHNKQWHPNEDRWQK